MIDGDEVKKCEAKRDSLAKEYERVQWLRKRPHRYWHDLIDKGKMYKGEIELRWEEYGEDGLPVFEFDQLRNWIEIQSSTLEWSQEKSLMMKWCQIQRLMKRECRRLEEGLPIYGYRQQILRQINHQQVMVLIGETGSGKSTQLVQFLVDSGIAADKSIVCTQPRKIAATSLAKRVKEESSGCYGENAITSYQTSSGQQFKSKVTYMTDHCLLQCYMKDTNLSEISCILVDEAHERSLSTDLLWL
ncbi:hypothetical protein M0R45_004986 [Rubus argutus]|uniref:RNA helicase n=1 Tax=Rubus argutus TaxID=59490 RepID=A0AAW1YLB8_RUBAR